MMTNKEDIKRLRAKKNTESQKGMSEDVVLREDVVKGLVTVCKRCDSVYCGDCKVSQLEKGNCFEMIKEIPSAQIKRPKGKWTQKTGSRALCCSICENCIPEEIPYAFDYCPNCGADMRGEEGEEDGRHNNLA